MAKKFSERLGEDRDSVFRMQRDGAITNWKCAIAVLVYLLSILGLFTCFISFFFLFFHGIPRHTEAQYYDQTIVRSNSCFMQNISLIEHKTKTAVAQYFDVSQDVTTHSKGGDDEKEIDPKYFPLKMVFCGRYLLKNIDFTNSTMPRDTVVQELKKKFSHDTCIQLIDQLNGTFPCFFNEKSTFVIDPRTTAKETAMYRTMKVISGLVGAGTFIICLPLSIISFIFIWKLNSKYYEDKGVKLFSILFITTITVQLISACACIVLPFLGWILFPMGTYAGFLIFAVFLVVAILLPLIALLTTVTFRFCFRYHVKYFRVLLLVSVSLIVIGIIYQIVLLYPLGIKGLQKLANFNSFAN